MNASAQVLRTARLALFQMGPDDAPFILRLLNEPSFLANIGDKGVRTLADAQHYIETGPVDMYARLGLGLLIVRLNAGAQPIGTCGLLRRDTLPDVDVGFAFLPEYWGHGYAREAVAAVLADGKRRLGLSRVVAITALHNEASRKVLEKSGFLLEGTVRLAPGGEELRLFANTALQSD